MTTGNETGIGTTAVSETVTATTADASEDTTRSERATRNVLGNNDGNMTVTETMSDTGIGTGETGMTTVVIDVDRLVVRKAPDGAPTESLSNAGICVYLVQQIGYGSAFLCESVHPRRSNEPMLARKVHAYNNKKSENDELQGAPW
ncbi:hypothetical protein FRC08_008996 [Ceratobasidium sp. 394]|nr:hypothetical protein FRC08_008996 [Ceratobasidium sp. 394]KAG9089916.1 hypothetical protein FS749_000954 [Ceratobasidium sp. UAMH 11750]